MSENKNNHEINYDGATYHVKELISLTDVMNFAIDVSTSCFSDVDNSFNPELKDFFIRVEMFKKYTDVDIPEDASEAYAFVYENERLFRMILCHVCRPQFDSILEAIDKRLEYMVNMNVQSVTSFIADIAEKMETLEKQISSAFNGVGEEDIRKAFDAVANYDATAIGMAKNSFDKKRE